jgi:hypothetical protein
MAATVDPRALAAAIAAGVSERPGTPDYLRAFVRDLYGGRCLHCHVSKPLAVAHLQNWPTIREQAINSPNLAISAFWTFHQPANVVLLCCNCHALLDNPNDPDITVPTIMALRDRERAKPRFGDQVRRFMCRELELKQRRWVDVAGLGPLMKWLEEAMADDVLEPPYRFSVPCGTRFWRVDLEAETWPLEDSADPTLPAWNGNGFEDRPAVGPSR